VTKNKPIEYEIQILLQKPLNECSLEEVVNGLMIVFRTSHMFDTIDCKDNGDYYLLILTHSLGLNNSKLNLMTCKSLFITYGADIESKTSGNIIFIKVFKDKTL
jgi:hypothetical protein